MSVRLGGSIRLRKRNAIAFGAKERCVCEEMGKDADGAARYVCTTDVAIAITYRRVMMRFEKKNGLIACDASSGE